MLKTRLSDHDVELLLCGKSPENKALTPLAPMLSAFHKVTWPAPAEEAVAKLASEAASIARSVTSGVAPKSSRPALRIRFLAPAVKRGLATGMAGVLLVSGLAGVAVASDDAAPGDFLYGIDRALESIGVGAGGASERISEAWALFESGHVADAVSHATQAVDVLGSADPTSQLSIETANRADALRSAAAKVGFGDDDSASAEVRAAVSAMLNEIAAGLKDPAFEGGILGQSIAEVARLIGGNDTSSTGPDHAGQGQPEPGKPDQGQSGPGNSDQASAPPFDMPPGQADDSEAAPSDPPGKSGEAPGKADSSKGKSEQNRTGPPIHP